MAKASAVSKRFEVKLAPVEAYQDYWAVPVKQKPEDVSLDDKIGFLMKINEAALKVPGVIRVQSNMAFDYEWKYLATSEGSYIEQEIWRTSPGFTVTALKNGKSKSRTFSVAPKSAGYEVVLDAKMLENVERIANEAVEHCTAPPVGVGLKDLIMTPGARDADDPRDRRASHRARSRRRLRSQLRRHQLREGERRRQADDGLEAVQRHLRPHAARAACAPSATTMTA